MKQRTVAKGSPLADTTEHHPTEVHCPGLCAASMAAMSTMLQCVALDFGIQAAAGRWLPLSWPAVASAHSLLLFVLFLHVVVCTGAVAIGLGTEMFYDLVGASTFVLVTGLETEPLLLAAKELVAEPHQRALLFRSQPLLPCILRGQTQTGCWVTSESPHTSVRRHVPRRPCLAG